MPILCNLIDLETNHGRRTFELWQGDITDPDFEVDILVVSYHSLNDDFSPHTVEGALFSRYKIDVQEVAEKACQYDLRQGFGIFLSQELPTSVPFRRLLCLDCSSIEDIDLSDDLQEGMNIQEALDNVFGSLALFEVKGCSTCSLALPVLGTGGFGYDPEHVLTALLPRV